MEKIKMGKWHIAILVVFVIGLFLGFAVGLSYKSSKQNEKESVNAELLRQLEKAKSLFPQIPEMRFVSGTVKGISNDVITIEASQLNPFEELPKIREVIVTQSTKIVKQEQKDSLEFQKELENFQKKVSQQSLSGNNTTLEPVLPPIPFKEKVIKLSDIKVGNLISAESDKNIKTSAKFEATRIIVQSSIALPASAPVPPTSPPGSNASATQSPPAQSSMPIGGPSIPGSGPPISESPPAPKTQ